MKFRALLILPLLALTGCAALGTVNHYLTSQKNPVVQAGVTLAVATAIGNGSDQKAKAAVIKKVASQVLLDSQAPTATIALLEGAINTEIAKLAPNPGELAAFMILSSTLESFLNGYIQTNPTGAIAYSTMVDIQGLAQAVITATSYYGV